MDTRRTTLSPPPGYTLSERPHRGGWMRDRLLANPLALALIVLAILLLTGLWSWTIYQIRREHEDALEQASVNLLNLARAFAEHTDKTLEGADQALRFVRREYLIQGEQFDIKGYLRRGDVIDAAYHLISVIGPDGFVVHSSQPFQKVDLRDREHFRVHAEGKVDGLFVSKPVLGRVSQKWSIQLTRRINLANGDFGGVVVLSLSPDYLTQFYREVDLGSEGVINLVGFDGTVRARGSSASFEGGQNVSNSPLFLEARLKRAGTAINTSMIDGVERLWAFNTLDKYRLKVFVGRPVADVLQEPAHRGIAYLAIGTATTLTLIAFMAFVLRTVRRQQSMMKQMRDSEQQAKIASEMKSRFLASVSHELRTPLNGILGYAELIRDTAEDRNLKEYGAIVYQSGEHLRSLVNTILDLARIESGRMVLHVQPLTLAEVIDEVQRLHALPAEARGLSLSTQLAPDAPVQLETDRTRLVQVLNNLVNNAIKFTERGNIVLSVERTRGGVQIVVEDTGIGIPQQQMQTLFERFHAADAEFVHPAQGAGLGLPLARELTELLGGTLDVSSVEGQGTRATVRLPLRAPRYATA